MTLSGVADMRHIVRHTTRGFEMNNGGLAFLVAELMRDSARRARTAADEPALPGEQTHGHRGEAAPKLRGWLLTRPGRSQAGHRGSIS